MKVKTNAEKIVLQHFKKDNIVSTRRALETNIKNLYKHKFVQELHIYVTKIGLVLSDCFEDISIGSHTYLGSIEFICKKVINNKLLYNVMKAIEINSGSNTMKHDIEDIKTDIDYILKQYNVMISELVNRTNIQAFKQCFLNRKQNVRDVAFSTEKKDHKYFIMEDEENYKKVKMQIKINDTYEYDLYSKTAKSKITLFWPESNSEYFINISVINTINDKVMVTKSEVPINKKDSKVVLNFTFDENDLDRRVISLNVKVELLVNQSHEYTTGALFWKKHHKIYEKVKVSTHVENLTQLYRESNKK